METFLKWIHRKHFQKVGTNSDVVRVGGIEPPSQVWKTCILAAVLHSHLKTPDDMSVCGMASGQSNYNRYTLCLSYVLSA